MLLSPVDVNWKKQQQQQHLGDHKPDDNDGGQKRNVVDRSACLIRHAGRALIRGRFRRVWRPRYLELWDNGLVRYYELPSTASSTTAINTTPLLSVDNDIPDPISDNNEFTAPEQQHPTNANHSTPNHHSPLKLPKATLRIFHARILDVTTFRDMQVGLPHGSYGFIFHAQREHEDVAAKATMSPRRHNHYYPPMPAATNALTSCHPTEMSMMTPRDYLCAVDTLEEAQSWVVALQWAALQESNWSSSSGANTPLERGWSFDSLGDHVISTSEKDPMANAAGATMTMATNAVATTPTTPPSTATASTKNNNTFETPSSLQDAATHHRLGKIVITKCRRYRWVRVATTATTSTSAEQPLWDVAYEIDLLLLIKTRRGRNRRNKRANASDGNEEHDKGTAANAPTHADDSNHSNPNSTAARDTWTVQEWSLLRTASDIENLLENLIAELGPAISSTNSTQIAGFATATLDQLHRQIYTLPYRRKSLRHVRRHHVAVSHGTIQQSLAVVDSILRTLALEAVVVNSRAMKAFWGLLPTTEHYHHQQHQHNIATQSNQVLTWELHNGTAVMAKQPPWTIPPHCAMETFVKEWLQEVLKQDKPHYHPTWWDYQVAWITVWALSTRYMMPCLVGIAAVGVVLPIWRATQRYATMAVTMRLDVMILSYAMAIQLGAWWSTRVQRRSVDARRIQHPTNALTSSTVAQEASGSPSPSSDLDDTSEVLVDDASSTSIESFDLAVASGVVDDAIMMQTYPNPYGLSQRRSSPLPRYDPNQPELCSSCWSKPGDEIFRVRGETYLQDRVKIPSSQSAFTCRGVDVWITDNPERHIARHPNVLGGRLGQDDTFLVNFLLPFANFVAYFSVPPLSEFPNEKLANVWSNFLKGDQQYRDARLKLLPVVVEGPWIVKAAVGPGTSPALLGKVIPLQYFFREPDGDRRGVYEVDVIITASTIAKGILSVVKGHTKSLTIAFAFIVEASQQEELPETVLCAFQVHALHLEDCPILPTCNLDEIDA